jgi:cell division protein FtsN
VSKPGNGNGGRTLSRDFKHVKRHATTRGHEAFSGWVGLGVGLSIGLSVALAVFLHYRGQPPVEPQAQPEAVPKSDVASDETTVVGSGDDLTFYDMLKNQEVDVPPDPRVKPGAAKQRAPSGAAILQAGSFKQPAEAERRVAQLATLGINARVVRYAMDDETWFRVQIGPIETSQEFESIKAKLADAEIEATSVSASEKAPPP